MYPGIDLWYSTRRATAWGGVQPGPQDKLEFMRRFTLLARYAPPNERYLAVHRLAKSAQEDHNEHRPETVACVCVCVCQAGEIDFPYDRMGNVAVIRGFSLPDLRYGLTLVCWDRDPSKRIDCNDFLFLGGYSIFC